MEKDERKNLSELSDAEFLSFLYAERDRESSLRQYQGWNLWALCGAIVTMVCVVYSILKNHSDDICIIQFLYCTSALMALLLCVIPLSVIFKKDRGYDNRKLKTIGNVAPSVHLFIAVIVSAALSAAVLVFDESNRWNVVSVGWLVAFVLFLIGKIVCRVNRDRIVFSYIVERVFVNIKRDKVYFFVSTFVLLTILTHSIKHLSLPVVGVPDYELSVCVSALVLLFYFLLKAIKSEKAANKIDILIDDFVYKNASKESTFRILRIGRMGNTVLESCSNEVIALGRSLELYEQKKQGVENVIETFEQGKVDVDKLRAYHVFVIEALAYLRKCSEQCLNLSAKLQQVANQVPELCEDNEYQELLKISSGATIKSKELTESVEAASDKMTRWIEQYHCVKYGGLCGNMECKHRNDKAIFRLRVKRLFNRTAILKKDCV